MRYTAADDISQTYALSYIGAPKASGYLNHFIIVSDLLRNADDDLFRNIFSPEHSLHCLLPLRRSSFGY